MIIDCIQWGSQSPNTQEIHCFKWEICVWFALLFWDVTLAWNETYLYFCWFIFKERKGVLSLSTSDFAQQFCVNLFISICPPTKHLWKQIFNKDLYDFNIKFEMFDFFTVKFFKMGRVCVRMQDFRFLPRCGWGPHSCGLLCSICC
jgi:hypothetical protein